MKMNVGERLTLAAMLPAEVSMADHRILRELREALGVTEEEYRDFEIVQTKDDAGRMRITWNVERDTGTDIPIGPRAMEIVMAHFKVLDDMKAKVPLAALDLYERLQAETLAPVEEKSDGQ